MSAQMAFDAAAGTEPVGNYDYDSFPEDPPRGAYVRVRANDYGRDPVEGELVELGSDKIGVRRCDPTGNNIVVHFRDWDMTSGQFGDSMYINYLQPKR